MLDSNGLENLALPLRVGHVQPDQRLGQYPMSDCGAEDIAALLTQGDCLLGNSTRLVHVAEGQEGLGKRRLSLSKEEPRPDPLGQGEAFLGEYPPAARVAGSRVSPRLPELDDVDAEQVTCLFGNTPGALVVRDGLRVVAPLVVESPSVLIGGGLREWVLDLLGQREAAVGVSPSPGELAGGCERQGGEARRGGLLALVPETGHLL